MKTASNLSRYSGCTVYDTNTYKSRKTLSGIKKEQKKMVRKNELFSCLLEKKDRTYNSVNDPERFTLEIELFAPVVRV